MSAVFFPDAYWNCRWGVNAWRTSASYHLLPNVPEFP